MRVGKGWRDMVGKSANPYTCTYRGVQRAQGRWPIPATTSHIQQRVPGDLDLIHT